MNANELIQQLGNLTEKKHLVLLHLLSRHECRVFEENPEVLAKIGKGIRSFEAEKRFTIEEVKDGENLDGVMNHFQNHSKQK